MLHAQRLEAMWELQDRVPLGRVTLCLLEYFGGPPRTRSGDYKRFLQSRGCWRKEGPTGCEDDKPFGQVPLDVSEAGRRGFAAHLREIAARAGSSDEEIERAHMEYMVRAGCVWQLRHSLRADATPGFACN